METVRAYVGLGTNVGDREANLRRAVEALGEREGVEVIDLSAFFEFPPVGGTPGQGMFLNAAAALDTTLPPWELLRACTEIEDSFGRTRDVRWGPRTMDIDILLYGDSVVREPDLEIPHPRMHEREFVLLPLLGMARRVRHPVLGKTVGDLLDGIESKDGALRRRGAALQGED